MKCTFCELYFKNKHGLHIHWHYCLTKSFSEMKKKTVGNKRYNDLVRDSYLISINCYLRSFIKFTERGEFGMKYDIRYILNGKG